MRTVGIRTLKNEATALLNANETLIVERHGTPIGVYIPLAARDRATRARSLAEFGSVLHAFLTAHGLTEDELVAALTAPTEPEPPTDAPRR
jgi:antitoxin (DNA-binding transcriptional repressor) of toxin-antitoxin stability system